MKILQVVNGYPPREAAGTEIYARNLARSLQGRHELSVFCRAVDRTLPEYGMIRDTVDGVDVVRVVNNLSGSINPERYFTDPEMDGIFRRRMGEVSPDIVHIHHLMGLSGGMMGVAAEMGVPVLVTLHDYWFICPRFQLVDESGRLCKGPEGGQKCARDCPNSLFSIGASGFIGGLAARVVSLLPSGMQRKLKQMVREGRIKHPGAGPGGTGGGKFSARAFFLHSELEKADVLVAPSRYVRDVFVENGFGPEDVEVIPHGIPGIEARPRTKSDTLRFGYLGSLAQLKGVALLIDAFGQVDGGAELHVHGHGGENHELIMRGLKEAAAGKKVTFYGRYAREDLGRILSGLDVVVVPSLWPETYGMVVREAMSCGVPVIVSDAGALPEDIEDGVNGLVFRCADARELADRMRTVAGDPAVLERFRKNIGPVKGLAQHVDEIEALYGRLYESARAGRT